MKADNDDNNQARSVTRALVKSVAKLEAVHGVSPEDCMEGMVKAAAVYALQKLGTPTAVAALFESFANEIRQLPEEQG